MNEEEVSALVSPVLSEGLLPLAGVPMLLAEGGRMINRGGRMIVVSVQGQGQRLIEELVNGLRADPAVARSLSVNDMDAEVVLAVFATLEDPSDVRNRAHTLIERLNSGHEEWTVAWPVMGLDMAPGEKLDVAGFSIGPLQEIDLQAIWRDVEAYACPATLADDPTPGSAGDHVRAFTLQALESSGCRAIGKVVARQDSIEMIVREEVSVAYDVLRSFSPTWA